MFLLIQFLISSQRPLEAIVFDLPFLRHCLPSAFGQQPRIHKFIFLCTFNRSSTNWLLSVQGLPRFGIRAPFSQPLFAALPPLLQSHVWPGLWLPRQLSLYVPGFLCRPFPALPSSSCLRRRARPQPPSSSWQ